MAAPCSFRRHASGDDAGAALAIVAGITARSEPKAGARSGVKVHLVSAVMGWNFLVWWAMVGGMAAASVSNGTEPQATAQFEEQVATAGIEPTIDGDDLAESDEHHRLSPQAADGVHRAPDGVDRAPDGVHDLSSATGFAVEPLPGHDRLELHRGWHELVAVDVPRS